MPRVTAALLEREFPQKEEKVVGKPEEREIVEWHRAENGQIMKVVKKVKVIKRVVRENKAVESRRHWKKFGRCLEAGKGAEIGITEIGDDVSLEVPEERRGISSSTQQQQEEQARALLNQGQQGAGDVKCRICGENHWTAACPLKGTAKGQEVLQASEGRSSQQAPSTTSGSSNEPGKYVVPGKRGAGSSGFSGGERDRKREHDDRATVRVSNLSENAKEADLYDLFGRFGPVQRIFIAKEQETNSAKGFAFVNFFEREDAARAIEALNGHGYDHLILSVDWARPANK